MERQAEERRKVLEYDRAARLRAARLRRRRLLLWWSLPVVLLALAAAWKAFSVPVIAGSALEEYEDGRYADAVDSYHWLQTLNVAEQWKVHFAEGTSLLQDGQLEPAVDELYVALDAAPAAPEDMGAVADGDIVPVCVIRTNLAVAHELQGDVEHGAADGHVARMKREQSALDALGPDVPDDGTAPDPEEYRRLAIDAYLEAEKLYREANEIRIEDGCADDDTARQRNVDRETEAREKREALEEDPPPPDAGDGGEPEEPQDPQEPQDPEEGQEGQEGEPGEEGSGGEETAPPLTPEEQRQADLERRNELGEQERQETEDWLDDQGSGGTTKNW